MADEGFYALALDGQKHQVRSVTSNPAHCLYCGIVDDDKAALVAERLMAPDMYSGWGIRTLSSSSTAYNPMSYHNGSVWPHDNAIAAAGLKRYGFDAATARIATGLFDVASGARDFRLPELLCGFQRDGSRAIVAYPVACIPQAWAATAPFMLAPGPARHLRTRAREPAHRRPTPAARLARTRRNPRPAHRPLKSGAWLSVQPVGQHRLLAARPARRRPRHDVRVATTAVSAANPRSPPAALPPRGSPSA